MKVLWFSVNSAGLDNIRNGHNGGGWIESMHKIVSSRNDIDLSISYNTHSKQVGFNKIERDGTVYYPFSIGRQGRFGDIVNLMSMSHEDKKVLEMCVDIIKDCKPDIIHIWGSENNFGLLYRYTTVPIVIHMQGSWPSYHNAWLPPGFSLTDELLRRLARPWSLIHFMLTNRRSEKMVKRETDIMTHIKFFLGRTHWDRALVSLFSPNAKYFYCSEGLRESIVNTGEFWQQRDSTQNVLVTVGAGHYLKGIDVVLKTAYILKSISKADFKWFLIGPTRNNIKVFEKQLGFTCDDVDVVPCGKKDADGVKQGLLQADVFVHTSYIDNSPNAVCEAQFLGLPIIATYTGGVPSLFPDEYPKDYLVPTNDPYYLASVIQKLLAAKKEQVFLSKLNRDYARARHDESVLYKSLLDAYNNILEDTL